MKQISFDGTFSDWQSTARIALAENLPPEEIFWDSRKQSSDTLAIFENVETAAKPANKFSVPKEFPARAKFISCYRDDSRWALLYRILWRLTHGEKNLLQIVTDPDARLMEEMERALRRDVHKMRAFVRFREIATESGPWFVAWFEPEHFIVERNAKFFIDRFASMRWSIFTPDKCAHWDTKKIIFGPGVQKSAAPEQDAADNLWRTYYSSIFNPARVKVKAMQKEMPKKYWRNLPEASLIETLLRNAPRRVDKMISDSEAKIIETPFGSRTAE